MQGRAKPQAARREPGRAEEGAGDDRDDQRERARAVARQVGEAEQQGRDDERRPAAQRSFEQPEEDGAHQQFLEHAHEHHLRERGDEPRRGGVHAVDAVDADQHEAADDRPDQRGAAGESRGDLRDRAARPQFVDRPPLDHAHVERIGRERRQHAAGVGPARVEAPVRDLADEGLRQAAGQRRREPGQQDADDREIEKAPQA